LIGIMTLAACQTPARQARQLAPLEDEAEVFVYAQPFPRDADRLALEVEYVAVVKEDGTATPLEVAHGDLSGAVRHQRLLAWGRIPSGFYAGLDIRLKKATVGDGARPAELVVPDEPIRARVPLGAIAGTAKVLWLDLRYGAADARAVSFVPVFDAAPAARPVLDLIGYCSSAAMNHLALFDKRNRQVVGVVPTGRAPRGVAVEDRSARAYVAVSGEDEVQVVDVARGEIAGRVRLAPGDAPHDLALTPDGGLLVVVNPGSRTASFVDPRSLLERGRVPVGEDPESIRIDRAGRRAYVFNRSSSTITVLDLANRAVVGTVATEAEPTAGDLDRAGRRLYVVHRGAVFMSVLSVPELAFQDRVFVGLGATAVRVDPRTDLVYVAAGAERRVAVYDPLSFVPLESVPLPGAASSLAIDDVGNTLVALVPAARSIAVVDLTTLSTVSTLDVGEAPSDVALVGERR
jgi:YVTN family beta-propeller protein